MTLDVDAARAAVQSVADAIGLADAETAAAGIIDIVNENMFGALRLVRSSAGSTRATSPWSPSAAPARARQRAGPGCMGSWPVIVPPSPGVLCAYGDATTWLRNESARTYIRRFSDTSGMRCARRSRARRRGAGPARRRGGPPRPTRGSLPGRRALPRPGLRGARRRRPSPGSATGTPSPEVGSRRSTRSTHRLFTFALDAEHELVNLRASARGRRAAGQRSSAARRAGRTRRPPAYRRETEI